LNSLPFFDTNILFYSISRDPAEALKRERAIAAARALGCAELYTEDMSHGRQVDGVLIINPFR
jgi:predicted nucleic acid-binding protein